MLQMFSLKRNWRNRIFIWYLKKNLNRKDYKILLRGRHSDRKGLYAKNGWGYSKYSENNIPIRLAETIGIYITPKDRR